MSGSGRPPEGRGWHSGPVTAKSTTRRTGSIGQFAHTVAGTGATQARRCRRRRHLRAGCPTSYLVRTHSEIEVTLLEAAAHVRRQVSVSDLAGIAVDEGAESYVASRPEALRLAREVGLESDLVTPRSSRPRCSAAGASGPCPGASSWGSPRTCGRWQPARSVTCRAAARPLGPGDRPDTDGQGRLGGGAPSPHGWAARSSTGWSSRCSAGSMPGALTHCRCRPRCLPCSANCGTTGRCWPRRVESLGAEWRPLEPGGACPSAGLSVGSDGSPVRWPRPSWAVACRSARGRPCGACRPPRPAGTSRWGQRPHPR